MIIGHENWMFDGTDGRRWEIKIKLNCTYLQIILSIRYQVYNNFHLK